VHFPAGVCSEDHLKIYPLLVNKAYLDTYGYGTSIIDADSKNSLIKEEQQREAFYQMLEKSYASRQAEVHARESINEKGEKICENVLVDYIFSINNQRVFYFSITSVQR
jgi:hypothetical protein